MKGCVWQRQKELALPLTRSRENICKQMLPVCVYPTLRDFKWKPAPHTVSLLFIIAISQALGGWRRKTQDNALLRKLQEVKPGERQAQPTQGHQVGTAHADPAQLLHPGQESRSNSGPLCQERTAKCHSHGHLDWPKTPGCSSWMLLQAGTPHPRQARPSSLLPWPEGALVMDSVPTYHQQGLEQAKDS